MKHKKLMSVVLMASLLSGCSSLDEWIINKGFEKTDIANREEYLTYQEKLNNNELDSDGKYKVEDMNEAIPAIAPLSDQIRVIPAENNKLSVKYFSDSKLTNQIDLNTCRFTIGDTIYISAEQSAAVPDPLYTFSYIRVFDIDSDGNKLREMNDVWDGSAMSIHIPDDYTGNCISLEPIGEYLPCTAKLDVYYKAPDGIQSVNGSWTIDGTLYNSKIAELDSSHSHNVSLSFDEENYYYADSKYVGFEGQRNQSGNTVDFIINNITDKECSVNVEVRKYISCELASTTGIISAKVNDTEISLKDKTITRLKVGDKIQLDLKKDYIAACMQFKGETELDGTRYTFVIPEINENIKIITAKEKDGIFEHLGINFDNAQMTVTVVDTGYTLKEGDSISGGDKVLVTITPNNGYYIGGSGVTNNTYQKEMKYSDYQKKREKLAADITISDKPIEEDFWSKINPFD